MTIVRFNTITSIPATMKAVEYTLPDKIFDKSIVDKSCYSPIEDQIAKVQPMTTSEVNQHFDFVNGKDDGRRAPLRQGADVSEIQHAFNEAKKSFNKQVQEESKKIAREREQKALVDSIKNQTD